MSCLGHEPFREAFQRSNVPAEEVGTWSALVDRMLSDVSVQPAQLAYVDVSLVDVFDRPDGQSSASRFLMCVFRSIGILLVREKGLFAKRKLDVNALYYDETPGLAFVESDREQGKGWGWFHIHGIVGGQARFTLGWPWSFAGKDRALRPEAARAERDRILAALRLDS